MLDELPQRHGCGWSADAALDAITALEQLRPLSDALRGPQPAPAAEAVEEPSSGEAAGFENALGSDGVLEAGSGSVVVAATTKNASSGAAAGLPPSGPVEPLRTLARRLLPTQQYGPLIGHFFDRQFHAVRVRSRVGGGVRVTVGFRFFDRQFHAVRTAQPIVCT